MATSAGVIEVHIESGAKRVFACACEWPGLCRSARDETAALEMLDAHLERFRRVAEAAGDPLPPLVRWKVVEHVPGSANTDFGVPHEIAACDRKPLAPDAGKRLAAFLAAAWADIDEVVTSAPALLRKGPRGGGRDRDAIVAHVLGAEAIYARKLGIREREPEVDDLPAITAYRNLILAAVRARPEDTPWPVHYAVRRFAWHVLDHAWEIQDRSA